MLNVQEKTMRFENIWLFVGPFAVSKNNLLAFLYTIFHFSRWVWKIFLRDIKIHIFVQLWQKYAIRVHETIIFNIFMAWSNFLTHGPLFICSGIESSFFLKKGLAHEVWPKTNLDISVFELACNVFSLSQKNIRITYTQSFGSFQIIGIANSAIDQLMSLKTFMWNIEFYLMPTWKSKIF